jgi:hypothetical protein
VSFLDSVRERMDANQGRIFTGKRVLLALVVIGVLIYLSTLDYGDDAKEKGFDGSFFSSWIWWVVIALVGFLAARWIRKEWQRSRRRDRDADA